ncbi:MULTISPECIES: epoxide hydrolase family protein [Hyphomicrobiales]|uniref:epoxide hydrolase family protein n=1 Tax=Hyphomicrobiales TaxID=356 RepID=UPI001A1F34B7|nr:MULTISPECIES: epoxide hydrolase family protein [Hyphomicrobiales]MBJ7408147.1 epoxide hydrolase [Bradyrhizobium sp.]MBX3543333.1 epoxide hydrolase [Chelatococcus sp.]
MLDRRAFLVEAAAVLAGPALASSAIGQPFEALAGTARADIQPFRISVPDEQIIDLKRRLAQTRWPDTLDKTGWSDGTNLDYLQGLVSYWRDRFDWRAQEARLNRLPQFKYEVDGLGLHFVHQRGDGPAPIPLILNHGWPGSFTEFERVLPLLTQPGSHGGDPRDAFHVIVPSMPGYGFSDAPRERGVNSRRIASMYAKLMTGLGYERFGAQGTDWGASVATWLAFDNPNRVSKLHLNLIPLGYDPPTGPGQPPKTAEETAFLERIASWSKSEGAYGAIQGTKPQSLAYGLNDSPAGLAAWIVEKFHAWGDNRPTMDDHFGIDRILTDISIYWFTGTIGSSMRLYFENRQNPFQFEAGEKVRTPTGVAIFPADIPMPPRSWVERGYNVDRWTAMPRGGHFPAMEEPQLLVEDIRTFFRPGR